MPTLKERIVDAQDKRIKEMEEALKLAEAERDQARILCDEWARQTVKYSHSDTEDETFFGQLDTEAEALAEALAEYEDAETVYVGECHKRTIGHYLTQAAVENMLESLAENAGDDCGESAEGWLLGPVCPKKSFPGRPKFRTSTEDGAEYQKRIDACRKGKADRLQFLLDGFRIVLETWATEEGEQPDFWHIENVKRYDRNGQLAP